jgi:1-deoxy-D-xylulose 5-phosphate reductoisomerase
VEEELLAAANEEAVRAYLADEALVPRMNEALENFDLYDDEKRELVSEELERDAMARAAQKAVKVQRVAKRKAKNKAAKQARKKQRR